MGFEIEQVGIDQIDELLRWRMETLHEVFARSVDADMAALERANRAYLESEIASGRHVGCLVSLDGEVIGCGSACLQREMPSPDNPSGTCAYLMNIYTRPAFRHRGAGRATVCWLVDRSRERGAGKIYLEASEAGRHLYEEMGFVDLPNMMVLRRA
jgi:GNAT superfamily N-acetyltransferase